jgi:hypothetical protein
VCALFKVSESTEQSLFGCSPPNLSPPRGLRLGECAEKGGRGGVARPASGSSQRGGKGGPARLRLWPEEGGDLSWPGPPLALARGGEVARPASGSGQRRGRGLGWPGLPLALACSGLELL